MVEVMQCVASALAKASIVLLPLAPLYARGVSAGRPLRHRIAFHRCARLAVFAVVALFVAAGVVSRGATRLGPNGTDVPAGEHGPAAAAPAEAQDRTPSESRRRSAQAFALPKQARVAWAALSLSTLAACVGGSAIWLLRLAAQAATLKRIRDTADLVRRCEGCQTVLSRRVAAPFSAGVFRPRIYLPSALGDSRALWLEAAIAHERSHIAKRHALAVLGDSLLGHALWFHPLAALLKDRGDLLREIECDRSVVTSGFPARAYGEAILAFAEHSTPLQGRLLAAVPLTKVSGLEERIRMLTGRGGREGKGRLLPSLALPAVLCAALSVGMLCFGDDIDTPPASEARETPGAAKATPRFRRPIAGSWRITLPFGPATDPFSGAGFHHDAVDIAARIGIPVLATASGRILHVGSEPEGLGLYLVIEHTDGWSSLYAHCAEVSAQEGQMVVEGEQVARVGATGRTTGPHLHFGLLSMGKPVDPLAYVVETGTPAFSAAP